MLKFVTNFVLKFVTYSCAEIWVDFCVEIWVDFCVEVWVDFRVEIVGTDRLTDRPTNQPTNQLTDRPTDRQRVLESRSTRLKICLMLMLELSYMLTFRNTHSHTNDPMKKKLNEIKFATLHLASFLRVGVRFVVTPSQPILVLSIFLRKRFRMFYLAGRLHKYTNRKA